LHSLTLSFKCNSCRYDAGQVEAPYRIPYEAAAPASVQKSFAAQPNSAYFWSFVHVPKAGGTYFKSLLHEEVARVNEAIGVDKRWDTGLTERWGCVQVAVSRPLTLESAWFKLESAWFKLESAWFQLQSAWFQLQSAWFQAFAFKWVNMCLYAAVGDVPAGGHDGGAVTVCPQCTRHTRFIQLNPRRLKGAWFQPWSL
jgi:hypothetical protein